MCTCGSKTVVRCPSVGRLRSLVPVKCDVLRLISFTDLPAALNEGRGVMLNKRERCMHGKPRARHDRECLYGRVRERW
eukprot:3323326-Pyramimonas_sp.AAC.1